METKNITPDIKDGGWGGWGVWGGRIINLRGQVWATDGWGGGEGACGVFSVSKLFSLFCLIVNSAEDNDNFRPFPSHAL